MKAAHNKFTDLKNSFHRIHSEETPIFCHPITKATQKARGLFDLKKIRNSKQPLLK